MSILKNCRFNLFTFLLCVFNALLIGCTAAGTKYLDELDDTGKVPLNFPELTAGAGHTCMLTSSGRVECWGDCSSGQCGDRTIAWNWSTYTNQKYHFSLDYPPIWKILEISAPDTHSMIDQVLFARPDFQPSRNGARAEITMIITQEDPSSQWEPHFFENYEVEWVQLRNVKAVRISGTNKESLANELVMIVQAGDYFIQSTPNQSPESLRYFDRMMSTFTVDF
jgi:hypothetical protein